MENGIYAAFVSGKAGQGLALLAFLDGAVAGADASGVVYEGQYDNLPNGRVKGVLVTNAPANIVLVQGVHTGSEGMRTELPFEFEQGFEQAPFFPIQTPLGLINVKLKKLRAL